MVALPRIFLAHDKIVKKTVILKTKRLCEDESGI